LFLKFLISENIITLLSVNRRNYFHYFQASHNTIINSYLLAATADAAPGFRAGGLTPSFCKAYTPHQGTNTLRKAKKIQKSAALCQEIQIHIILVFHLGLLRPLIFCNRLTVPKKTGQPVNRYR